jgi:tetratricopeptide (TPR) repeat protein
LPFGFALSLMWAPSIATVLAKPLTNLFDGGDLPPEPRPLYSIARALRGKGKYLEAVVEVRKQLDRFPTDLEGVMLLAEIQAEHLNDLPGAEIAIHRFCDQPDHAPQNLAFALNTLADWHLKLAQDREAAQQALKKIIELCPETEMAVLAEQRLAHVADIGMLLAPHDRRKVAVPHGVEFLGLVKDQEHLRPAAIDPAAQAAKYVKHLEQHPLDGEAREKLAVLYAEHYHRLDLATGELEQLIRQPHQPVKQAIHWLNLLADLQIKCGADYEAARHTLQTIIDLYPDLAAAENARNRINHLRLEMKVKEKSRELKLGTYEQDIGLKRKV